MKAVHKILENARNGIPQALARFNDGEVGILFNKDFTAARGDQKGSLELQVALLDSIKDERKNYWKGYPCPVCMKKQREQVEEAGLFSHNYEWNTLAVVNTNRNWKLFSHSLPEALKGKQVIWVSGDDQDLINLTNNFDFNIIEHVSFSRKNSWEHSASIMNACIRLSQPHRVFLFSCGPTARVMVKNLFMISPDATFLDIGSTYDPFTRNVWHKCHTGKLKECSGCN